VLLSSCNFVRWFEEDTKTKTRTGWLSDGLWLRLRCRRSLSELGFGYCLFERPMFMAYFGATFRTGIPSRASIGSVATAIITAATSIITTTSTAAVASTATTISAATLLTVSTIATGWVAFARCFFFVERDFLITVIFDQFNCLHHFFFIIVSQSAGFERCFFFSRDFRDNEDIQQTVFPLTAILQVLVILWINIGYVEEAIATDAEIDEGSLDTRLDVHDLATVDVADETFLGGAFDVKFFEGTIFQNGYADFFIGNGIDQHLLADTLSGARGRTLYFGCHFIFLKQSGYAGTVVTVES
jgi:hypothetical protein